MKKYVWIAVIGAILIISAAMWRSRGSRTMNDPQKLAAIISDPIQYAADGSIDFVEMLNARLSGDIHPEANAFVDYLMILGPNDASPREQAELCRWLEIGEVYSDNPFVMLDAFTGGAQREDRDAWDQVQKRPWRDEEFPKAARWLELNGPKLQAIHLAAQKPDYFYPLVSLLELGESGSPMVKCSLRYTSGMRDIARLLAIHGLREAARGDYSAAIADMKTIHRIAGQVGQGRTATEKLLSVAIDSIAVHAAAAVIGSGELPAEQLADYRQFLRDHRPKPEIAECVDTAERWMALDIVQAVELHGIDAISEISGESGFRLLERKLTWSAMDWSVAASVVSDRYDAIVEIVRQPNMESQLESISMLEGVMENRFADSFGLVRKFLSGATSRGKLLGDFLFYQFLQSATVLVQAEARIHTKRDMLDTALAIAEFRLQTERLPGSLDELVPKYLEVVPSDRFIQDFMLVPLTYRVDGYGIELVSVGNDGRLNRDGLPPSSDDICLVVRPFVAEQSPVPSHAIPIRQND